MSWAKRFFEKHSYICVMTLFPVVGIILFLNYYYALEINTALLILIPFLWICLIRCFDCNKQYIFIFIITAIVLILSIIYTLYKKDLLKTVFTDYQKWWLDSSSRIDLPQYSLITLVFVSLAIILFLYSFQKALLSRLITASVMLIILIIMVIVQFEAEKFSVVFFFAYLIAVIFELVHRKTYNITRENTTKPIIYLFPIVFILMIGLFLLPFNKEPIQWIFVKSVWSNVVRTVSDLAANITISLSHSGSEFGISFSGYSEDGDLGGDITTSDIRTLVVTSTKNPRSSLYLTGNQKNSYDGHSWTLDYTQPELLNNYKEYELDTMELLYAVERAGLSQNVENIFIANEYNIVYDKNRTKTMFYPSKTKNIFIASSSKYKDILANISFNKLQGPDTTYRLNYLDLNLGSSQFKALIHDQAYQYDNSYQLDEGSFLRSIRSSNLSILALFEGDFSELDNILKLRQDTIIAEYTALPDKLPERVYSLAQDIAMDSESDYEKLLAIEAFLRTYTYTLTPGRIPKDKDAVDYFLFEAKEGYCTYFATAMAVLGRCVGVPTRYVQGYCVARDSAVDSVFQVTKANAHAWAECYLEGIGWIPFEATPGYNTMRYSPWFYQEATSNYTEPLITPEPTIFNTSDFISDELPEELPKENPYRKTLLLFLWIPVILVVCLAIYIIYKIKNTHTNYEKCSKAEKMYISIAFIYELASYLGHEANPADTILDFFTPLQTAFPEEAEYMKTLCASYMRIRYGKETQMDFDLATVDHVRNYLQLQLKNQKARLSYFMIMLQLSFKAKSVPISPT